MRLHKKLAIFYGVGLFGGGIVVFGDTEFGDSERSRG
jgi:hypothetical protein